METSLAVTDREKKIGEVSVHPKIGKLFGDHFYSRARASEVLSAYTYTIVLRT